MNVFSSSSKSSVVPMSTLNCNVMATVPKKCATRLHLRIADSLRLPILATNGVRYAPQYEREVLDIFTSVRHHVSLDGSRAGSCRPTLRDRYASARAMRRIFSDLPEAIENTRLLSQRLAV